MLHRQTSLSLPPAASVWLLGLNATALTPLTGPFREWAAPAGRPDRVRLHSRMRPVEPPAASICPFGLNETVLTCPMPALSGAPSGERWWGLAAFHRNTRPSELAAARIWP